MEKKETIKEGKELKPFSMEDVKSAGENFYPKPLTGKEADYDNLQRQIDVLRDDFQKLEEVFHTQREKFETEIGNLMDEIKKDDVPKNAFGY